MKKLFRKHTVREMLQAELEELELLRYREDQRRDYHAAQVAGFDARMAKIKEVLNTKDK